MDPFFHRTAQAFFRGYRVGQPRGQKMSDPVSSEPAFKIHEVRGGVQTFALTEAAPAEPPLGPLADFLFNGGKWAGNGFNMIFRPNKPSTGLDNVLELNLTTETLDFSPSLGSIPNRGEVQDDIFLNGVPYLQKVKDVTTPGEPTPIHFEPGIWLSVPATTNPAVPTPSVVRMGSIPHGTTILAQGTSTTSAGGPVIPPVNITPFFIGQPTHFQPFASQTAATPNNFRIPSTLPVAGTSLTAADWQDILNDPNSILRKIALAETITDTTTISITTASAAPLVGGGTPDIAFLEGNPPTSPNAKVFVMTATFFIETVTTTVDIPGSHHGHPHPVIVSPKVLVAGQPVPKFRVTPKSHHPTTITVKYKQIQYTQTVMLNFAPLTWPHVSVATLVPANVIDVSAP